MAMRRRRKNTKKQLEMAERRKEALQLRLAGASYQAIADHLGVSKYTAYHDVQGEIADIPKELASELRREELMRLDTLQRAVWKEAVQGNIDAVKTALQVVDRRIRMMGLDAPTAVNVGGGNTDIDDAVNKFIKAAQEPRRDAEEPAPAEEENDKE